MATHHWAFRLLQQTIGTVVAAAGLAATAVAAEPAKITLDQVRVENAVSRCMTLEPKQVQHSGSVVKLLADARFISSTGECGCKSALLRYRVYAQPASGRRVEARSGTLNTLGSTGVKAVEFVLGTNAPIRQQSPLILSVGCAHEKT